jgi:hypothetical protein
MPTQALHSGGLDWTGCGHQATLPSEKVLTLPSVPGWLAPSLLSSSSPDLQLSLSLSLSLTTSTTIQNIILLIPFSFSIASLLCSSSVAYFSPILFYPLFFPSSSSLFYSSFVIPSPPSLSLLRPSTVDLFLRLADFEKVIVFSLLLFLLLIPT